MSRRDVLGAQWRPASGRATGRHDRVTYAAAAAAGILLVSKAKTGEAHDIVLQGNIPGITRADTLLLLAVSIPVLLVHVLFYEEFLLVRSTGRWRARWATASPSGNCSAT